MKQFTIPTVMVFALGAGCLAASRQQSVPYDDSNRLNKKSFAQINSAAAAITDAKLAKTNLLIHQGDDAKAQGHNSQAEAFYRHAIAIEYEPSAWLGLVEIYELQHNQEATLKAYHELVYPPHGALNSIGSSPNIKLRYVLALLHRRQWPEAVEVYDMAMRTSAITDGYPMFDRRFDPQHPDWEGLETTAHLGVGITTNYAHAVDPKEQRKHLEAAVRLQPRWALAQYHYGVSLEKARQYLLARAAYQKAALLSTDDIKVKAEGAIRKLPPPTAEVRP